MPIRGRIIFPGDFRGFLFQRHVEICTRATRSLMKSEFHSKRCRVRVLDVNIVVNSVLRWFTSIDFAPARRFGHYALRSRVFLYFVNRNFEIPSRILSGHRLQMHSHWTIYVLVFLDARIIIISC